MRFGSQFHEFFDRYIATTTGEITTKLGGLAMASWVFINKSIPLFRAAPRVERAQLVDLILWAAGAMALMILGYKAGEHRRDPLHVPPQRKRNYVPSPSFCMVRRFKQNPDGFPPGEIVCGAQELTPTNSPQAVCRHAATVQQINGAEKILAEHPSSPLCAKDLRIPIGPPIQPNEQ